MTVKVLDSWAMIAFCGLEPFALWSLCRNVRKFKELGASNEDGEIEVLSTVDQVPRIPQLVESGS